MSSSAGRCHLGNLIVNHFLFADDIVIFAPSSQGLQELFNGVVFNVSKSQCLIVHSRGGTVTQTVFRFCSFALPYTDNYVYLGHDINSRRLTDDAVLIIIVIIVVILIVVVITTVINISYTL